jgi:anti-anti-sigma factor
MKVRESRHSWIHVFHIYGDIDLHYTTGFRELFQRKIEARCVALVVDFTGVTFVSSTGIAVLLEYLRDATQFGGQLCVVGLNDQVRQVFEIVRLDKALALFANLDEAKAALQLGPLANVPEPLFSCDHDDRMAAAA